MSTTVKSEAECLTKEAKKEPEYSPLVTVDWLLRLLSYTRIIPVRISNDLTDFKVGLKDYIPTSLFWAVCIGLMMMSLVLPVEETGKSYYNALKDKQGNHTGLGKFPRSYHMSFANYRLSKRRNGRLVWICFLLPDLRSTGSKTLKNGTRQIFPAGGSSLLEQRSRV